METTINGATYQIRKLTPMQQFHIARRLAPMLFAIGAGAEKARGGSGMAMAFEPAMEAIAAMSDADSEFVIGTSLSVVYRQQGSGWAPVQVPGAGMMFQDIDLQTMLKLVFEVGKENLGNFFDALQDMQAPPEA